MGSMVTIIVELDRHGHRAAVNKELPIFIVEDALVQLDLPAPNTDVLGQMLCSSPMVIQATIKARSEIATVMTKAILDALGAKDKRMGYPR